MDNGNLSWQILNEHNEETDVLSALVISSSDGNSALGDEPTGNHVTQIIVELNGTPRDEISFAFDDQGQVSQVEQNGDIV